MIDDRANCSLGGIAEGLQLSTDVNDTRTQSRWNMTCFTFRRLRIHVTEAFMTFGFKESDSALKEIVAVLASSWPFYTGAYSKENLS